MGAGVVPEDAGADHLSRLIEHRRAVHLAREPDALQCRDFLGVGRRQFAQNGAGGRDPGGGVLLAPARFGMFDLKRGVGAGQRLSGLRHQKGADARGAQIQTDEHASPPLGGTLFSELILVSN